MSTSTPPIAWRSWSAAGLAVLIALLGGALSVAVGQALAHGQRSAAELQVDRRSSLVGEAVANEAGRYVDTLRIVAAGLGAADTVTPAIFARVTRPLVEMRLAGAASVDFMIPAMDDELAAVERQWRTRGALELHLSPDPAVTSISGRHIFSVISVPLDGRTTPRVGIDATRSAAATQTLNAAFGSGQVAISEPYQLIIDQSLPAAQRQMSFALSAPVYEPADSSGRARFRGWVMLNLRGQDFMGTNLRRTSQDQIDVTLTAPTASGSYATVAALHAPAPGRRDVSREVTVSVANRLWQLRVDAVAAHLPGVDGLPHVVEVAGAVLSLLLAGLVYVLATGRARAQAQVQRATADLTDAEATARHHADLLDAIMDSISDGIGVVDPQGEFLLQNRAAQSLLGIGPDQGSVQNWQAQYGIFRPDGTAFPTEELPLVRALNGESTDEVEMMVRNPGHPEGIIITVSGRPLRTADGRDCAVAVFHDVSARKAAEAQVTASAEALRQTRDELAAQEAYLTQVLDAVQMKVITCDRFGNLVHVNTVAAARLAAEIGQDGHSSTSTVLTAAVNLQHSDGSPVAEADTPLVRALTGEHVDGMEARRQLPDGSFRSLLMHARPLRDSSGNIIGAVGSTYDVTALHEKEAELRTFAAVVAHDLKSPLTSVGGYVELIEDGLTDGVPGAELQPHVHRIQAGVHRMRRLIDDLLTYATARDAPLHLEQVDLADMFTQVIAERTAHLRSTATIDGDTVLFPDIYIGPMPVVHVDRSLVRQVLDNLVGNALKYTLPGQAARIDIAAHRRADDPSWVRLEIADRGIGIPPHEQPLVFDSFHRATAHSGYAGTGLGLAICHRVVTRHGGRIGVTDNPGGGARFWLQLPTVPADLEPAHRPDAESGIAQANATLPD